MYLSCQLDHCDTSWATLGCEVPCYHLPLVWGSLAFTSWILASYHSPLGFTSPVFALQVDNRCTPTPESLQSIHMWYPAPDHWIRTEILDPVSNVTVYPSLPISPSPTVPILCHCLGSTIKQKEIYLRNNTNSNKNQCEKLHIWHHQNMLCGD